jgi:hypothetical protein
MRLPRVRFTVRWALVAVAALAVSLGLVARRQRLLSRASYHAAQAALSHDALAVVVDLPGRPGTTLVRDAAQPAAGFVTVPGQPGTRPVSSIGYCWRIPAGGRSAGTWAR